MSARKRQRNQETEPAVDVPPFVPWISWGEWCSVYRALCAPNTATKQWAIDRITSWEIRGKVPTSVACTAHILACGLHYDDHSFTRNSANLSNETISDRLSISMAIIRLVNGLIDPLQTKAKAMSVNGLAMKLGLPRVLVDLRHEATHTNLPTLGMLLKARALAIDWLHQNYWFPQYKRLQTISQSKILAGLLSDLATERLKYIGDGNDNGTERDILTEILPIVQKKSRENTGETTSRGYPFPTNSNETNLLDKMYERLKYCPDTVIAGVLVPMLLDGRPQQADDLGTTLSSPSDPPPWTFDSPLIPSTRSSRIATHENGFLHILKRWIPVIYDIQSRIPPFVSCILRGILERCAYEWNLFNNVANSFAKNTTYFCGEKTDCYSCSRRFFFLKKWLHFFLSRRWMSLWNADYARIPRANNPKKTTNLLAKKSWNDREREFMSENVSHQESFDFQTVCCSNTGVQYIKSLITYVDVATGWLSPDQWNILLDKNLGEECSESWEASQPSKRTTFENEKSVEPSESSLEDIENWLEAKESERNKTSCDSTQQGADSQNHTTGDEPGSQQNMIPQEEEQQSYVNTRKRPRWRQLDKEHRHILILPIGSLSLFKTSGFLE